MLYIVEKIRNERTGEMNGYEFYGRYYQWGIGRTMPLNILGGVLSAYDGGFTDGIHARHIFNECRTAETVHKPVSWKEIVDEMNRTHNNNGAIVVQIDNQFNRETWERKHIINISFMIGSEEATDTRRKIGDEISLKEWLQFRVNRYMDSATRRFFRQSIHYLTTHGFDLELNFKFDSEF